MPIVSRNTDSPILFWIYPFPQNSPLCFLRHTAQVIKTGFFQRGTNTQDGAARCIRHRYIGIFPPGCWLSHPPFRPGGGWENPSGTRHLPPDFRRSCTNRRCFFLLVFFAPVVPPFFRPCRFLFIPSIAHGTPVWLPFFLCYTRQKNTANSFTFPITVFSFPALPSILYCATINRKGRIDMYKLEDHTAHTMEGSACSHIRGADLCRVYKKAGYQRVIHH